jgi:hypothetical protein
MPIPNPSGDTDFIVATIASGQTSTGEIDLQNMRLGGIGVPAAMTGANFTIQANINGTLKTIDKGGSDYSVPATVSKVVWVDPSVLWLYDKIAIVSDGAEAAERTLVLAVSRL